MKKTLTIILMTRFMATLLACSQVQQVKTVDAATFERMLGKTSRKIVLDVRTRAETAQGVIANAQLADYNAPNFEVIVNSLDKNKPVFVYCAVGGRSAGASEVLAQKGFKQIYNLSGGINAWRAAGYPVSVLK